MNSKTYTLPNGKKAVFEYDVCGIGKITLECMDELMGMIADRPQGKWIDAEYCEDFFDRWESRVKNADPVTIDVVQNTRTLLRDAPSIDIVRCKECKHKDTYCDYCHKLEMNIKADDFCSYGERSE